MDSNNFEKNEQNSEEVINKNSPSNESEAPREKQIPDASTSNGAYYNNGPRLPRSEASARPARSNSGGQAMVLNKEKLAIVIAMGALALILLSVVLLITFCGGASGHKHQYDYTLSKDGDNFVLVGKCTLSGCPKPNYVEKNINDSVVLSKEIAASCKEEGKKVYSYKKDGVELVYSEITEDAKEHSVNGKTLSSLRNEDGTLNYDPLYIVPYAGTKITCGITVDGIFQCPECKSNIPTKVKIDCMPKEKWTPKFGKEATCTKTGVEELLCKYCEDVLETREAKALGHDISYMLKKKDSVMLVSYCSRCVEGGSEKPILPTDANLKREVIPANCTSPTKTVYTYKMADGKVLETTVESGTTVGKCVVGGKEFVMPTAPVPYNTPGLKYPPNQSEAKCGGIGEGYFVCDVCGKPSQPVKVLLPGEHGDLELKIGNKPSKAELGLAQLVCKDCGQGVEAITLEKIPENLTGSNYTLTKAPSATDDGEYTYRYVKDGKTYTASFILEKVTTTP